MFYHTVYNTHNTRTVTMHSTAVPRIYVCRSPAARTQPASHTDSHWPT